MSWKQRLPRGPMGWLGGACSLALATMVWTLGAPVPARSGAMSSPIALLADAILVSADSASAQSGLVAPYAALTAFWANLRAPAAEPAGAGSAEAAVLDVPARALSPEALAAYAWQAAEHGDLVSAQAQLDALLRQYPDFRPALTLRGLLAAGWRLPSVEPVERSSARAGAVTPPADLGEEAALRLAAQRQPTAPAGWLPANLLQVAPTVHTVLAADVSQARLYVLQRIGGTFQLTRHVYLSTGARGSHKHMPGDQRTPVGIYSLGHRLPASQLPPLAGAGAWPLQFPNRWDQWQGHLGSGIWLHGSAPGQHDGLPHSTNGCLAVSNEDLLALASSLSAPGTVLLVADQLEWIDPAEREARRTRALARLGSETILNPQTAAASLYAYPGESDLLLVRSGEDRGAVDEHFWPLGAVEPLRTARN